MALAATTGHAFFYGIYVFQKAIQKPDGSTQYRYFYFLKDMHVDYANCLFSRRQQKALLDYLRTLSGQPTMVVAEDPWEYSGSDSKTIELLTKKLLRANASAQEPEEQGTTGLYRTIREHDTPLFSILDKIRLLGNVSTCGAEFRQVLIGSKDENRSDIPRSKYIEEANSWFAKIKQAQEDSPPWYPVIPQLVYKRIITDNKRMNELYNTTSTKPLTSVEYEDLREIMSYLMDAVMYYHIDQHDTTGYVHNFYLFGGGHINTHGDASCLKEYMAQRGYRIMYNEEILVNDETEKSGFTTSIINMELKVIDLERIFACIGPLIKNYNQEKEEEIIQLREQEREQVIKLKLEQNDQLHLVFSQKKNSLIKGLRTISAVAGIASSAYLLYNKQPKYAGITGIIGAGMFAASNRLARWWYGG